LEIADAEIEIAIPMIEISSILILKTSNTHTMPALRRAMVGLMNSKFENPSSA
jgi:(E)-4-hydroxy-3-methylbut-2-enyl-diphosphate synthase